MAIKESKYNTINGLIIINKPRGMTSFDCVFKVRKALHVKKAGHTGTLDPNATGVLPICLGKATKAVSMVQEGRKVYKAEMILGLETDTYDVTGEVLRDECAQLQAADEVIGDFDRQIIVTEEALRNAIAGFIGEQDQMPPIYSAKKVNGKKLYEYAREGQEVEIRPTHINIEKIDLLSFDGRHAEIRVFCSKGTYIRSLVHDIGKAIGCGAVMGDLLREKTGNFSLADSITLEEINENVIDGDDGKSFTDFLQKKIISTSEIFSYKSLHVTEEYEKNALNGMKLYPVDFEEGISDFTDEYYKIFMKNDFFVGIYERDGAYLRPFKMFLIDESLS